MSLPGTTDNPLRVAIVGAGPAGFFAAGALLKQKDVDVRVDIFDRLPAPFGLVRYGVAPDHAKIKSVRKVYTRTADDERVRFFGNVEFGSDVTRQELLARYDQVLYTVGAQSDRRLGIDGEDFEGSYSATEFVAWYNGHPDFAERSFDLSHTGAVVVGAGNVAMDVARILAKSVEELDVTDIAVHAVDALRDSQITDIYILSRRGPAQAKFTNPEIKEFGKIENAFPVVRAQDLELDDASAASLEGNRTATRNVDILRSFVELEDTEGRPRRVHFLFNTSPVEILGDEGQVTGVKVVRNELRPTESGYIQSYPTEEFDTLSAGLVLRSVGYRGVPLPDVPFADRRGTIPHADGRVLDAEGGEPLGREYVAGWIKRGPSGVIGTNKSCANESVQTMLADLSELSPVEDRDPASIEALLESRDVRYVSFDAWKRIDAEELAAGEARGRARVKFVTVDDFLERC